MSCETSCAKIATASLVKPPEAPPLTAKDFATPLPKTIPKPRLPPLPLSLQLLAACFLGAAALFSIAHCAFRCNLGLLLAKIVNLSACFWGHTPPAR